LAHNIIYGAVEFALENDIEPDDSFILTEMILEEDDERIPLIDIEFGHNGVPLLVDRFGMDDDDFDDDDDDFDDDEIYEEEGGEASYYYEDWTKEQWEHFLDNPDETDAVSSFGALLYIFDRCYMQEVSDMDMADQNVVEKLRQQHLLITDELLREGVYKQSEEEEEIFLRLSDLINDEDPTRKELTDSIEELVSLIQKWPQNPFYYNLLAVAYERKGKHKKVKEICKETVDKFPDYLFGRTNYSTWLLLNERMEEVPGMMKNKYTLGDMYPHRNEYHISEFVTFHGVWCRYFCQKLDPFMARLYMNILRRSGIPENYLPLAQLKPVFALVELQCLKFILPYIKKAEEDEEFKRMMIERLV
jgi:tetratricopeptide (TPR) repeat protein